MTPKNTNQPLVPYIRQSRTKERTISLDEQRRAIQAWAKANDVKLAPEIVEQNVSGKKPWQERGLGQAIANCGRVVRYIVEDEKAGTAEMREIHPNGDLVQGVIVAYQDRLSRENGRGTAEVWEALEAAQARLVIAAEGLDTAKGDQELQFQIKAAIARDQWKRHAANWKSGRRNAIERGVHVAKIPFGYDRPEHGEPLVPDPVTAPYLRGLFERRATGWTWSQIADWLNEESVPKRYSKTTWTQTDVAKLCHNEVYLGIVRDAHTRNEREGHEPLVSLELWYAVKGIRDKHQSKEKTPSKQDAPLGGGYVRCAHCAVGLTRTTSTERNGQKYGFYICRNPQCRKSSISAAALEPFVYERLAETAVYLIEEPQERNAAAEAARQDVDTAELAIQTFDASWADQGLSIEAAASMRKALEAKLAAARERLAKLPVDVSDWRSRVRKTYEDWSAILGTDIDPEGDIKVIESQFTSGISEAWLYELLVEGGDVAREIVRQTLRSVTVTGKSGTPGKVETRESVASRVAIDLI